MLRLPKEGSSHELFVIARRVAAESSLQLAWNNVRTVEVQTSYGFRRARSCFFAQNRFGVTHYGNIIVPVASSLDMIAPRWRHIKTDVDLLEHAGPERDLIPRFLRELKTLVDLHVR